MSLPKTTREYRLLKVDGFHNLTLQEAPIPKLKSVEVLVKVHAVSLQVGIPFSFNTSLVADGRYMSPLQHRDLIVANGEYPLGQKDNLVPVSDMAGEIVAVGEDVKGWRVGERVSSNFAVDHIHGKVTAAIKASALGAPIDGVLTEYRTFPAYVSFSQIISLCY